MMPLHIVTVFSSITPAEIIEDILNHIRDRGAALLTPKDVPGSSVRPSYVFVGTGGTERIVADLYQAGSLIPPVILLAHDRSNSLPASMEIRAYLESRGVQARIVHSPLPEIGGIIKEWAHFQDVLEKVRNSSLAIIGEPSFWLIASGVDPEKVRETWGLKIKSHPISVLTEELSGVLTDRHQQDLKRLRETVRKVEVSEGDLHSAALVTQRLAEFVGKHRVDAVTVECFRLLEETGVSGCYALSFLNDQCDITAGCEGDICSTFTMMMARHLTGQASFMANVSEVDEVQNSAVFAHCTVATSLTNSHEILSHFETGLSVGIRGEIPLGRVTVLKIAGDGLTKWWVSGGEVVENLRNDTACRTQVRVHLDKPVSYFLEESLANHHVLLSGDHAELIERFLQFAIQ